MQDFDEDPYVSDEAYKGSDFSKVADREETTYEIKTPQFDLVDAGGNASRKGSGDK